MKSGGNSFRLVQTSNAPYSTQHLTHSVRFISYLMFGHNLCHTYFFERTVPTMAHVWPLWMCLWWWRDKYGWWPCSAIGMNTNFPCRETRHTIKYQNKYVITISQKRLIMCSSVKGVCHTATVCSVQLFCRLFVRWLEPSAFDRNKNDKKKRKWIKCLPLFGAANVANANVAPPMRLPYDLI